ncbi:hypothetical protein [Nocardioides sp. 1609]|uniref:hypothetical protein n=1 Tax=Nocardioides sp. 1609 TaxID=2508327 RepID=UPI00107048AA|nr:hypothetical protein [Nocardioides sp. 1609]
MPPDPDLAQRLLDAQVAFHLDRLGGDELAATARRAAEALLDAAGRTPLEELVDRDVVADVVRRALGTVPGSAAVGGIVELATEVVLAGPAEPFPVGDLAERAQVEAVLDAALALTPVVERALDRLTDNPLAGALASRFTARIVAEVLQANRAVADRVPGLGALMSFGTSAASRVVGAADKQLEGLLGDAAGRGGTYAVQGLNRIVVETLRDPTTRAALLEAWDELAAAHVDGLGRHVERDEVTDLVDGVHALVVGALATEHVGRLTEVVVHAVFDRFGGYAPAELLDELDLDRADLVEDVVRLVPGIVDVLRESGDLERALRAELAPFYASAAVTALLA